MLLYFTFLNKLPHMIKVVIKYQTLQRNQNNMWIKLNSIAQNENTHAYRRTAKTERLLSKLNNRQRIRFYVGGKAGFNSNALLKCQAWFSDLEDYIFRNIRNHERSGTWHMTLCRWVCSSLRFRALWYVRFSSLRSLVLWCQESYRRKHHGNLKCRKLLTERHSVMSQKVWVFSVSTLITSDFAFKNVC
jgi:hypothetical protein